MFTVQVARLTHVGGVAPADALGAKVEIKGGGVQQESFRQREIDGTLNSLQHTEYLQQTEPTINSLQHTK